MTKRRLKAIRLDKIAAVDKPCQEHAVAAIFKHAPKAPAGEVPPAFAKKTFQEALAGQLISEQVSDVFWRAFENQWAVRDAFRTALTDEVAAGGDGSVATEAFTAAMQQLAVSAANAAREAASTAETDLEAAVEEAVSKWLQHQEQPMKITTKAALAAAISKFAVATSTVAEADAIRKAAVELDAVDTLPAELAPPAENTENAVLKRKVAILEMTPEVRKHFDGLPEAEQDAFLAKSADDQAAVVEAIQKGDPVVYTCADGTQIRKSDGQVAAMLAKQNDKLTAQVGELSGTVEGTVLEKRAIAEFPNVGKSVAVDMLKSAAALGVDTEAGKAVMKSLTQMNKTASGLFKSVGSAEDDQEGTSEIRKARVDFNGKVAEIQKRDGKGQADAMTKARQEYPDLHAAAFPAVETETEEQDA